MGLLSRVGILGMNERNHRYVQRLNPRRLYPLVDDKLATKALCIEHGLSTPELLGQILDQGDLAALEVVRDLESFVLKPARGAMGNGILVIKGRDFEDYVQPSGRKATFRDLRFHALDILAGLYALGGKEDAVVIEECLEVHPDLARVSSGGVPDLRVIVFRGIPAMAMMRLPTVRSRGRANLHQGAIGAGVSIATGTTCAAVLSNQMIRRHPDTGELVVGIPVPGWAVAVELAVKAADLTGLGYLGVDIVVDRTRGPLVLELNARPGLAIQIANRRGLKRRLERIEQELRPGMDVKERIDFGAAIEAEA